MNSFGFSHAAKCPPSLWSLLQTRLPVCVDYAVSRTLPSVGGCKSTLTFATSLVGTGASSFGCHEYPKGFLMYQFASGWNEVGFAPKNWRYG